MGIYSPYRDRLNPTLTSYEDVAAFGNSRHQKKHPSMTQPSRVFWVLPFQLSKIDSQLVTLAAYMEPYLAR